MNAPVRVWHGLAAFAFVTSFASCSGPDCVQVIPAVSIDGASIRATVVRTGQRTAARYPLLGVDPLTVSLSLPAGHCAGDLSLRVAQVVGPDTPAADVDLLASSTGAARSDSIGRSTVLRKSDASTPDEAFVEESEEHVVGPGTTDRVATFPVPQAVDEVVVFAEGGRVALLTASFTTAPRPE